MRTLLRRLALIGAVLALTGCGSFVAPPYSPQYESLDRLKLVPLDKVAVGAIQPRDSAAPVNRVTLRGTPLRAPNGSFAQYLEDALKQDLLELALFDAGANVRIDAVILKNDIDVSGLSTGTGTMEVDLTVSRGGAVTHRRAYRADTRFESSFAGAVAIPRGQIEYGNLVRTLLGTVYADPDFVNALKRK